MKSMAKIFNSGLIVGRFQVFHLGHYDIVSKALDICDKVILFIGSSQESRTSKNPLTFEERRDMIAETFQTDNLIILPLPDAGIGNNEKWGEYVLSQISKPYITPEIAISGRESRRSTWFDTCNISEMFVAKTIEVSATEMRNYLKNGDKDSWMKYSPEAIHHRYEELRKIILDTQDITYTKSI